MADDIKDLLAKYPAQPWGAGASSTPMADIKAVAEAAREHGESIADYCHRMNTSDEPEAVAFRERWAAIRADEEGS